MKVFKTLLSIICVTAILLASAVSATAIGFDAETAYQSVFVVTSGNALGSGFSIGENCIVTNAHVLGDSRSIQLTAYSGEQYTAYLIGQDTQKDIAVLGVSEAKFIPLKTADLSLLKAGDDVYAIGAPKSMAYTLTKGVVSAKERKVGDYTYIQTDAAINEGNSGGPLLNDEGNVIGINSLKLYDSEGIGLAIPMAEVNAFVRSLNIELDAQGVVGGAVSPADGSAPPATEPPSAEDQPTEEIPTKTKEILPLQYVLILSALALSFGANILLLILWIFQKRKNLDMTYDPRERTDFDIDILE